MNGKAIRNAGISCPCSDWVKIESDSGPKLKDCPFSSGILKDGIVNLRCHFSQPQSV